jgi:iron only hydrogenase large subunit-like protein
MENEQLSPFVHKTINDLKKNKKIFVMLAPSYVVDFKYPDVVIALRQMGFDKVCEITFGAKMINRYYHEILKKNPDKMFVSSTCPVIVTLVKSRYPQLAGNLVPVVSPMVATARIIRKYYPKHDILFIAPCMAKREEAKQYGSLINNVLTYRELKELIDYASEHKLMKQKKVSKLFDKFYAEKTKIYPLSGGLTETMHAKSMLKEDEVIVMEGAEELGKLLGSKLPKNVRFLDILFCCGGCIGGPGVVSKASIKEKREAVMDCFEFARRTEVGKGRALIKDVKGIKFNTPKNYIDDKYYCEC